MLAVFFQCNQIFPYKNVRLKNQLATHFTDGIIWYYTILNNTASSIILSIFGVQQNNILDLNTNIVLTHSVNTFL